LPKSVDLEDDEGCEVLKKAFKEDLQSLQAFSVFNVVYALGKRQA